MNQNDILDIRARLNLTQLELADLIGVSRINVIAWEQGLYKPSRMRQARLRQLMERGKNG